MRAASPVAALVAQKGHSGSLAKSLFVESTDRDSIPATKSTAFGLSARLPASNTNSGLIGAVSGQSQEVRL